jgi:CRISPR-associated protein Csm3
VVITPRSPILVKAGGISANPALPDMQFVRTLRVGEDESIYIPGSSLKGVLRSYMEKVLRTVKDTNGACDPFEDTFCGGNVIKSEQGAEIYQRSCRACKIFGNTRLKGRLSAMDAYPKTEVKTETRHGVAISRLTHSVAQGPFDMEVVISGEFSTKLILENFEVWQLGLLALTLDAFNEGMLRLGFGKNRGFGEIKVEVKNCTVALAGNGVPQNEIWGVGTLMPKELAQPYGFRTDGKDKLTFDVKPESETNEVLFLRRSYSKEAWEKIKQVAILYLKEGL